MKIYMPLHRLREGGVGGGCDVESWKWLINWFLDLTLFPQLKMNSQQKQMNLSSLVLICHLLDMGRQGAILIQVSCWRWVDNQNKEMSGLCGPEWANLKESEIYYIKYTIPLLLALFHLGDASLEAVTAFLERVEYKASPKEINWEMLYING